MNILLVNGHEYWESSPGKLNETLLLHAFKLLEHEGHHLKISRVDRDYDLEIEVQKNLWADVILYFSPVYWMSITSKLKSYFDHVYAQGRGRIFTNDGIAYGGQYGSGGLMQKKKYMLVTTWNAPKEAFGDVNQSLFKGKQVDDVFLNFHAMQSFIGMQKLPSFSVFDVKRNPQITLFLEEFEEHLKQSIIR